MKTFTLRTATSKGEVVNEDTLTVNPNDILVQEIPDGITFDIAARFHKNLCEALEDESRVITLPLGVKLKVLSIKDN